MTMTTEKIEELKRLADALDGAKWTAEHDFNVHVWGDDGDAVCKTYANLGHTPTGYDEDDVARFIAAANPQAILSLLALAERALEPQGQAQPAVDEDGNRIDYLETLRQESAAKGFKWNTFPYDTDKPIRATIDTARALSQQPSPAQPVADERAKPKTVAWLIESYDMGDMLRQRVELSPLTSHLDESAEAIPLCTLEDAEKYARAALGQPSTQLSGNTGELNLMGDAGGQPAEEGDKA